MVTDNQRIPLATRGKPPCKDCTERFTACSDRCPKDARGEFGYKAYKTEIERVKRARREYIDKQHIRRKRYDGGYYGQE